MLIVIDDFLPIDKNKEVVNFFTNHNASESRWFEGSLQQYLSGTCFMPDCLKAASKYYDLTNMIGCEMWCHYNTRPDWHYDKDEQLWQETKEIKSPLCSIVYYGLINDLVGGKFMTETVTITPKTNRLIIFSSGIHHKVEKYTGDRLAIALNPWNIKPKAYL
jgi:hypothetical protein